MDTHLSLRVAAIIISSSTCQVSVGSRRCVQASRKERLVCIAWHGIGNNCRGTPGAVIMHEARIKTITFFDCSPNHLFALQLEEQLLL
jgi:hypothetical protein